MAIGKRKDPLRNFRYRVEIDGIMQAGFSSVSGFDSTIDTIDYREGTDFTNGRKLPGLTKFGSITLRWGMTDSAELYNWHREASSGNIQRKNVSIIIVDEVGNDKARWDFINVWPSKYSAPELTAQGNEVAIETIELIHEGMTRVS